MQGGLQGGGLNVNSLQLLQGSKQGGVAAETSMVCGGGGWVGGWRNTRQPGVAVSMNCICVNYNRRSTSNTMLRRFITQDYSFPFIVD